MTSGPSQPSPPLAPPEPPPAESRAPSPTLTRPRAATGLAAALLALHAALLALSIPRNFVTVDEYMHLPVGISYWRFGEFWPYHHNPPLTRLLFALPAVIADVPMDYDRYHRLAAGRGWDRDFAGRFLQANRDRYMQVYVACRLVVAGLSVLGGWLVYCWSRELWGAAGGLISLALWAFCPNLLAHGGLVTPDVGATVIGFAATYAFWRYLREPSLGGAVLSGLLLGLAEAAKFSLVVLPLAWIALALVRLRRDRSGGRSGAFTWRRAAGHGAAVLVVSVVTLNNMYLWEGTGRTLGSFAFHSTLLTTEVPGAGPGQPAERENRFRGTILDVPVPLPEHYLLGLDDQSYDVDRQGAYKYLRGELREPEEPGWWWYYLYGLLVKTPPGALLLLTLAAVAALCLPRCRRDALTELTLALPLVVMLATVSSQTLLNAHLRYVLPVVPFAFVFAGRLGRAAGGGLWRPAGLCLLLGCNVLSVLKVHPHYLTYFNEPAGGPRGGWKHLADSNIDWGQGAIALREWLDEHAPGRTIRLAYFGFADPEVLGIRYELPPFGEPAPGLQAVSVNFLAGIPWGAPDGRGNNVFVPPQGLTYFRRFETAATPGHSIYVYDLSIEEVNRVRREMNLPKWDPLRETYLRRRTVPPSATREAPPR